MENQKSCKGIISVLCIIIVILLVLVVLIGTGIISFKSTEQQVSENNNSLNTNVSQKSSVSKFDLANLLFLFVYYNFFLIAIHIYS